MKYRLAEILAAKDVSTAGTETIDVKLTDVISRISLRYKGTNNGDTPTAHPAAMISKIELVDGSDVIFSASGREAQAVDFYDRNGPSPNVMNYADNEMAIFACHLNFGRSLWDPVLALDPRKFRNLQLKITHNKASGGSAPDAGELRVHAACFDEAVPSPIGFFMTKEIKSYPLTSGAYDYTELPKDYLLRKLVIMARFAGKEPFDQVNELRLSEDNDKKVPIDSKVSDLISYMAELFDPITELIRGINTGTSAQTYYITPTYEVQVTPVAAVTNGYFLVPESYGGQCSITPSAANNIMAMARGYCPHGAVPVLFGRQEEPGDWYDVTKLGSLQMRIKGGSSVGSSSTYEVVTQQLRKY